MPFTDCFDNSLMTIVNADERVSLGRREDGINKKLLIA